jgi:hypothetical protein
LNLNRNKQIIENVYLVAQEIPACLIKEEETPLEDKVK